MWALALTWRENSRTTDWLAGPAGLASRRLIRWTID